MSEHLFPLSERARTLLAKFRTFIEQEDFDAVEKRIVADYARAHRSPTAGRLGIVRHSSA
jgi:hypothetical protein